MVRQLVSLPAGGWRHTMLPHCTSKFCTERLFRARQPSVLSLQWCMTGILLCYVVPLRHPLPLSHGESNLHYSVVIVYNKQFWSCEWHNGTTCPLMCWITSFKCSISMMTCLCNAAHTRHVYIYVNHSWCDMITAFDKQTISCSRINHYINGMEMHQVGRVTRCHHW